jgi:hypothetical protein
MKFHRGRALAVALLCAVAGTIGIWSGALASATGALHSGATSSVSAPAPAHR